MFNKCRMRRYSLTGCVTKLIGCAKQLHASHVYGRSAVQTVAVVEEGLPLRVN